jgi:hypothetical protein
MSVPWFGRWVPAPKPTEDKPDFSLLEKRINELIAGDAEAAQHADAIKAEIAKLATMRAACIMPRQLDEAALDNLKQYFRILLMVHKRVPSSNIVFKWVCTVTPRGGGVFTSDPAVCKGGLGLELRAVAYQMAVCCAAIAARLAEGEQEQAQQASKWFKNAYMLFNHARDNIEVDLHRDSALNRDLKPDVLHALSRVMLAQAANVFVRVMSGALIQKYEKPETKNKHERERAVRVLVSLLPVSRVRKSILTPPQLFQWDAVAHATCTALPLTHTPCIRIDLMQSAGTALPARRWSRC